MKVTHLKWSLNGKMASCLTSQTKCHFNNRRDSSVSKGHNCQKCARVLVIFWKHFATLLDTSHSFVSLWHSYILSYLIAHCVWWIEDEQILLWTLAAPITLTIAGVTRWCVTWRCAAGFTSTGWLLWINAHLSVFVWVAGVLLAVICCLWQRLSRT